MTHSLAGHNYKQEKVMAKDSALEYARSFRMKIRADVISGDELLTMSEKVLKPL